MLVSYVNTFEKLSQGLVFARTLVGSNDGILGNCVGLADGNSVGDPDGSSVGTRVGPRVGAVGALETLGAGDGYAHCNSSVARATLPLTESRPCAVRTRTRTLPPRVDVFTVTFDAKAASVISTQAFFVLVSLLSPGTGGA